MATGIYLNDDDSTYTVTFPHNDIMTTVTASGAAAAEWILETLNTHHNQIVGLDLEWRPNRQSGGGDNMVALIQLCVGDRCLIFQILNSDFIPPQLSDFLKDERFRFAGVGIQNDIDKLIDDYELTVLNTIDLRQLADEKLNMPELRNTGLAGLVRVVMGINMQKPMQIRLSEWDRENLTSRQIKYACADAFLSYEVGRRLFYNEF